MYYANYNHQKSDFAMYGTEVRMLIAIKPDNCGYQSADCSQKKNPPEYAGNSISVLGESREPVALPIMKVNVVTR